MLAASTLLLVLGGCASKGEVDATGGITAVRSVCPSVAIPAATGDVTLFQGAGRDQGSIDVAALMTNVRSSCSDATDQIGTTVTFDVRARRTRTDGARDVQLPYFITVVRGGSAVVAKRIGRVSLHFDAGQPLAQAQGQATATVSRAAATLSADVREKLTRKRKAGDQDAAVDPLSQPDVRQAVLRASFEALVGFQLTDEQLKYNATR
ncbi:hypothetical protein FSB78_01900 [Sphingomonas ginsenosidivorax]|uniref:Lipoprotein n=1 Tax=Sphingomonas ginsenosidivorax TaxID=862135 RepID=A0A5C6UIP5_9SPHN|nr:hypothetical protein FSB78_01900 [Sphingomonas ginsenosidivorax]